MSDDPAVWQKTVTVGTVEREPVRIFTPDGRVLIVSRNEAGFRPTTSTIEGESERKDGR